MQPTAKTPASPIQVPEIEADEPVTAIPLASVAPLEGRPDGERINTFAVEPAGGGSPWAGSAESLRDGVMRKPLTYLVAAFSLGYILARAMR